MTRLQLGTVIAVRLLAIYLLFQACGTDLSNLLGSLTGAVTRLQEGPLSFLIILSAQLTPFLIVFFLWTYAVSVARYVLGMERDEGAIGDDQLQITQGILFSAIGLWVAIEAASPLLRVIQELVQDSSMNSYLIISVIERISKLGIGLWLLLKYGSNGHARDVATPIPPVAPPAAGAAV